jgi:hypothetical protein
MMMADGAGLLSMNEGQKPKEKKRLMISLDVESPCLAPFSVVGTFVSQQHLNNGYAVL